MSRERFRCAWFLFVVSLVFQFTAGTRGAAASEKETGVLLDPAARPAAIEAVLGSHAARLAREGSTTGSVSAVMIPEGSASATADEADAIATAARAALGAAGWTSLRTPSRIDVVTARVPEGVPIVVVHPAQPAIFTRQPDRPRRAVLPEKPDRDDGRPMPRDYVAADRALQSFLWGQASSVADGPGSLRSAVAEVVLREAGTSSETPDWLRRGLVAWLARAASGKAGAPESHVCGSVLVTGAKGLAQVIEGRRPATAMEARVLGRIFGSLAAAPGFPARVAAAAAAPPGPGDAAFAAAFGRPLETAVGDAIAGLTASAGPCDKSGGIDCPLCVSPGSITVACPNCEGLGKLLCTACAGAQLCPCSFCYKGRQYLPGRYVPATCVFCSGKGKVPCVACAARPVRMCRLCSGSGKIVRVCPSCTAGRVPCPMAGRDPGTDARRSPAAPAACPWCRDAKAVGACRTCRGVGYSGCPDCAGLTKTACDSCLGIGRSFRNWSGWWIASSACTKCGGAGSFACGTCTSGKNDCTQCNDKGQSPYDPSSCGLCAGSGSLPDEARDRALLDDTTFQVTGEESRQNAAMTRRAVDYLLTCRASGAEGPGFALRYLSGTRKGELGEPSLFSNAFVLWTLTMAGVDREDPRVAACWTTLRSQVAAAADSKRHAEDVPGTQEVALGLRALIAGKEPASGELVTKLIALLVKGQRPNGLWADDVISKDAGEPFPSLFVVESLYLAQRAGAKVPPGTFSKAHLAASSQLRSGGPADLKGDWLSATEVTSNVALVVLAKAGSLGNRAATFDYASLPQVRGGIAFLDRYFDVRQEPIFAQGARNVAATDTGYAAYLFAVQRLAQLLSIPVLNGDHWAVSGSRHLRGAQQPDGSFIESSPRRINGPVRCTCSAILFLVRATQPITESAK